MEKKYLLCDNPWDDDEIDAIKEVVASGMYTMGQKVFEYEKDFARRIGSKYAVMVNSGSSANLIAIAALVYSGKIKRGSEVIVPAVSWSTTYYPLEQYGIKVVFVDIDRETLNLDVAAVEKAISPITSAIMAVNLLGNSNEYDALRTLANNHELIIIEDNCESLGAEYAGKKLGTIGCVGTFSTFYSHHLCTMEGGVVVTDDSELYEYLLAIRAHGWTRNLPKDGTIYKKNDNPFYESFNFIVPGYNVRPLEMEGAIGLQQLRKMDRVTAMRRQNACYFKQEMQRFPDVLTQKEIGSSSWFGFSVVLRGRLEGKRDLLVRKLIESGIEVRPIVAGNFVRNPVIKYFDYRISGNLVNADYIHDNGLFIGNHSKDNHLQVDYFISVLDSFVKEVK